MTASSAPAARDIAFQTFVRSLRSSGQPISNHVHIRIFPLPKHECILCTRRIIHFWIGDIEKLLIDGAIMSRGKRLLYIVFSFRIFFFNFRFPGISILSGRSLVSFALKTAAHLKNEEKNPKRKSIRYLIRSNWRTQTEAKKKTNGSSCCRLRQRCK